MSRVRRAVLAVTLTAVALAIGVPGIWRLYLWWGYPDSSLSRIAEIQRNRGVGNDCRRDVYGSVDVADEEIRACFSGAVLKNKYLYEESSGGREHAVLVYACDGENFRGEAHYLVYSTSEKYQCVLKISDLSTIIPEYKTGDIPAVPPKVSVFARTLIGIVDHIRNP